MEKIHTKKYIGTPFTVKCTVIENNPGTWNSTKVSIYRDDLLLGEYIRNYSDYGSLTFCPFLVGNAWYALYSANYTSTRVMKLHNDRIEDWCGELDMSTGFCPVEFYIPDYNAFMLGETHKYYNVDSSYDSREDFISDQGSDTCVESAYCNFGFMCGCYWGDDSSWKLRYIDLSKIENKEIIITEKFGYWELPSQLSLRQCINMESWAPDHNWITLVKSKLIDLNCAGS